MNNKTYSNIQIIILASLILAMVLQVVLFYNVSDRMTAIEQKQAVLDHRLEGIFDNVYSLSTRVNDLAR